MSRPVPITIRFQNTDHFKIKLDPNNGVCFDPNKKLLVLADGTGTVPLAGLEVNGYVLKMNFPQHDKTARIVIETYFLVPDDTDEAVIEVSTGDGTGDLLSVTSPRDTVPHRKDGQGPHPYTIRL